MVPSDQANTEIWTQNSTPVTNRPDQLQHRLIAPPPVPTCEPATITAPPATTPAPNTTHYTRHVHAAMITRNNNRQPDSGTTTA